MRPAVLLVLAAFGLLPSARPAKNLHATDSQLDHVLERRGVYCEPGIECLWSVSGEHEIRIGIEVAGAAPYNRPIQTTAPSPAMTVRDLLNRTVAAEPRYEWREVGNFITVRPRDAWDDDRNTLNREFGAIELSDAPLREALEVVCPPGDLNQYVKGRCHLGYGPMTEGAPRFTFSVHFPGGTLLEAINAVVGAHGAAAWRYGHFTIATNVTIFGRPAPDEIVPHESLQVRLFRGWREGNPPLPNRP